MFFVYNIEIISGFIAACTAVIGLLPQIYKSFKTKSMKDVSMLLLINYLVGSIAWIIYGMYTNAIFTIVSNIIGTITSIIAVAQKIIYDNKT